MAETVGVVKKRESYNLVKIVALIKDAQALSYVNNTDSSDSLERERVYSRELSFIYHAQNTVLVGIEIIDFNKIYNREKDGIYSNIKVVM